MMKLSGCGLVFVLCVTPLIAQSPFVSQSAVPVEIPEVVILDKTSQQVIYSNNVDESANLQRYHRRIAKCKTDRAVRKRLQTLRMQLLLLNSCLPNIAQDSNLVAWYLWHSENVEHNSWEQVLAFACDYDKLLLTDPTNAFEARIQRHGFVDIKKIIPGILSDVRYAGKDNFLGRIVNGYEDAVVLITMETAIALKNVQNELCSHGLGLKIFDAYRPQRAVKDFIRWSADPSDTINKQTYYPDIPKTELFDRGYISERSGHTRGSTLDLTLITLDTGKELDMGGPHDFFGVISHHETEGLAKMQRYNRSLLKSTMEKHGFRALEKEWWHYTLVNEPYPDRYFNFPVRSH